MLYILGIVISMIIWLIKGNGSMKESYNSGRNDFMEMIKGESDATSK